jgi:hypothetical protein
MKKLFKYIFLLPAVMLIASCSESYLDINTDPNNPTSVTPDLALPVAQNLTATYLLINNRVNTLGNLLMYNWSQSDGYAWYPDEFKYLVTSSFYATCFNTAYQNPLKQYQTLDRPDDPTYDYYTAISMIMKAFHFQILVDIYGDIPYSEALLRSLNPSPVYDDALTVYEDLIVKLSAAIDLIDNASDVAIAPADDDIIFGGDMTSWKQFANTIKMRILVRQSDMSGREAYIQDEIDAILAEGSGFITTDVGVNPGYVKETNKQNPFWDSYGEDAAGTEVMNGKATCASDYVLEFLDNTNDPRIDLIYEEPATGHLGVPQGLLDYDTPVKDAYTSDKVSNIGPGILKGPDQDAIIFTLAESNFNLAEAALKGYLSDDPQDLYESGITASFHYLTDGAAGYEAQAETYYSQAIINVGWTITPDEGKLEAIITQKWIALNGIDAIQSWFDYNRTGFPSDLPISLLAVGVHDDRPVRLMYPASELASNADNVPDQPEPFTEKIFWAQ